MKQNNKFLLKIFIINTLIEFVLGTLLHFTFEWSNNNLIVGAFSSVNESTWEHLKLVFFPMLLTTIIGLFFIRKSYLNYICSRLLSIVASISFIVVFFYTYTGIIGTNFAFLDILSFFIAVLIGEFITFKTINNNSKCNTILSAILLLILLLCFILFTYFPVKIGLFKDPVTNSYGIVEKNT